MSEDLFQESQAYESQFNKADMPTPDLKFKKSNTGGKKFNLKRNFVKKRASVLIDDDDEDENKMETPKNKKFKPSLYTLHVPKKMVSNFFIFFKYFLTLKLDS